MESAQSENLAEPTDLVQLPISVDCIKQEITEEEVSQDQQEKSSCSNSHEGQEEEDAPACNYIEPGIPREIVIGEGHHWMIGIHTVAGQEELKRLVPMLDAPIETVPEQCVPVQDVYIKAEPEQCVPVVAVAADIPIKADPEQANNLMPVVVPRRRRQRSFRVPIVPSQHPMILRNRRSTMYNLRKLN